jgi:hypothetical protein
LQKPLSIELENNNWCFRQKTAKTPLFAKLCLGVLSSFASFARDQRTLVNDSASRRGVTPVTRKRFGQKMAKRLFGLIFRAAKAAFWLRPRQAGAGFRPFFGP